MATSPVEGSKPQCACKDTPGDVNRAQRADMPPSSIGKTLPPCVLQGTPLHAIVAQGLCLQYFGSIFSEADPQQDVAKHHACQAPYNLPSAKGDCPAHPAPGTCLSTAPARSSHPKWIGENTCLHHSSTECITCMQAHMLNRANPHGAGNHTLS
jgi:hypothetical protein